MEVEEIYSLVPCEDGNVIFVITDKGSESSAPRMEFDGEVALLRLQERQVLLKNLMPEAIKLMEPLKQVYISEVDQEKDEVARLYPVPLFRVSKITIPEELA